ncbi:MAG TPA: 5-oxoprolinase subunit PxpB [Rudaea sp.]|nr:5-oxoprolinase subunit PxpB [Rudaea sp.]
MNAPRIEALGDRALLIHCGETIDAAINARALAIARALEDVRLPGILDIAPAYASVCVRYEPAAWTSTDPAQAPFDRVAEHLRTLVNNAASDAATDTGSIEIAVTYGGQCGPDIADVAAHTGLSEEEVVARHGAAEYSVAMLGFTPGFPYLLGLDPTLHMPRRATPRTRVPAGSVAIGGAQTGVYPRETPGGWHLIGRTTQHLFDPARDPPALLKPGMRVKFIAE